MAANKLTGFKHLGRQKVRAGLYVRGAYFSYCGFAFIMYYPCISKGIFIIEEQLLAYNLPQH